MAESISWRPSAPVEIFVGIPPGGEVQWGKKAGVATPCNLAVWDVLALHAGARRDA